MPPRYPGGGIALPAELSYNSDTSQLLHLEKFIFYFV